MKTVYIVLFVVTQLIVSSLVNAAPPGEKSKAKTLILTIQNDMGAYQVLDAQVIVGDIPARKNMDKEEVKYNSSSGITAYCTRCNKTYQRPRNAQESRDWDKMMNTPFGYFL